VASFAQHLYGAAAVSSATALGAYELGWAGAQQAQLLFLLGVGGGLLPDIDSNSSKPVRGFFTLAGVVAAFFVGFSLVGRLPAVELLLTWCLVFVSVRYVLFEMFARFTVHRGIWHSWVAMAFAGLAGTNGAFHLLGVTAKDAWLVGGFLSIGYLTHLCLDELASVDLLGHRLRRSFGTALKPFSLASPGASLAMLGAVLLLYVYAPSPDPLLEVVLGPDQSAPAIAGAAPPGSPLSRWLDGLVP
jgi:hypothetical protein